MTKPIVFSAAAVLAMALLGSPAAAAENEAEREVHDRAQIEKLMWQYVRALDTENADAYAAVYTPDGQFGSGANAVKGREALKKMINDLRQRAAENEAKSGEMDRHPGARELGREQLLVDGRDGVAEDRFDDLVALLETMLDQRKSRERANDVKAGDVRLISLGEETEALRGHRP